LRDFSLEIPAGQIAAIVGLNGAGKSTLFKLLCRLYDVDSGSVTVDGVDLRRMRLRDLRRMTTMLFQHVMVDGEIVESGTHSQLVARDGYYEQSWKSQMKEVV
jgi:ATP-binding cassette subfamily B protein